jgi:hypothetical protein
MGVMRDALRGGLKGAKIGFGLGLFGDIVTWHRLGSEMLEEPALAVGIVMPFALGLILGLFGLLFGMIIGPPLQKTGS